MDWQQIVREVLGTAVRDIRPLSGGCVGQAYRLDLADGSRLAAKVDERPSPCLDIEGFMLTFLSERSHLPVPKVIHSEPRLLLMTWLPGGSRFGPAAQEHAAELLADLHQISADDFGLERDTLIGGLHQPNGRLPSWLDFFRQRRLLYMAEEACRRGRLPAELRQRVEQFCARLDNWLTEPARPSLIHGDVWTTNVLAQDGRITGFVDPAIYFAHPEIELAFTTLFGTFGQPFFSRYQEIRPIAPGFFEERRHIYNLYPLLVHVRLFGGSYVHSVDQTLCRFGY